MVPDGTANPAFITLASTPRLSGHRIHLPIPAQGYGFESIGFFRDNKPRPHSSRLSMAHYNDNWPAIVMIRFRVLSASGRSEAISVVQCDRLRSILRSFPETAIDEKRTLQWSEWAGPAAHWLPPLDPGYLGGIVYGARMVALASEAFFLQVFKDSPPPTYKRFQKYLLVFDFNPYRPRLVPNLKPSSRRMVGDEETWKSDGNSLSFTYWSRPSLVFEQDGLGGSKPYGISLGLQPVAWDSMAICEDNLVFLSINHVRFSSVIVSHQACTCLRSSRPSTA